MKSSHHCKRGPTLQLEQGQKCPLCGETFDLLADERDEIRERLRELDRSDRELTSWEAGFVESILHGWDGPLTDKQRAAAERMLESHGY